MQKIIKKLQETKGTANVVIIIVFIIITVILIAIVSQIVKAYTIGQNVRGNIQQAVVAVATENAYNVYGGVREGNTANKGNSITKDVKAQLKNIFKLNNNGDVLEHFDGNGKLSFTISDLDVKCVTVGEKGNNDYCLNFTTTCFLNIPLRFSNKVLTTANIHLKIKSIYMPLY